MNILAAIAVGVVTIPLLFTLLGWIRIMANKDSLKEWADENYHPRDRIGWSPEKGWYTYYG